MKKLNKKGFTIVELVIVIAVIGILSAVLIPTFSNLTEKANESAAIQEATNEYKVYLTENAASGEVEEKLVFAIKGTNGYKYFVVYDGDEYVIAKSGTNYVTTFGDDGSFANGSTNYWKVGTALTNNYVDHNENVEVYKIQTTQPEAQPEA